MKNSLETIPTSSSVIATGFQNFSGEACTTMRANISRLNGEAVDPSTPIECRTTIRVSAKGLNAQSQVFMKYIVSAGANLKHILGPQNRLHERLLQLTWAYSFLKGFVMGYNSIRVNENNVDQNLFAGHEFMRQLIAAQVISYEYHDGIPVATYLTITNDEFAANLNIIFMEFPELLEESQYNLNVLNAAGDLIAYIPKYEKILTEMKVFKPHRGNIVTPEGFGLKIVRPFSGDFSPFNPSDLPFGNCLFNEAGTVVYYAHHNNVSIFDKSFAISRAIFLTSINNFPLAYAYFGHTLQPDNYLHATFEVSSVVIQDIKQTPNGISVSEAAGLSFVEVLSGLNSENLYVPPSPEIPDEEEEEENAAP